MNAQRHDFTPDERAIHFGPERELRELPDAVEAEQALLGAILVNNDAFFRVADFLKPEHFFDPLHAKIYGRCTDAIQAGNRADPILLKPLMKGDETVGDMTVAQYIARLAVSAVTIINAKDYGKAILDTWERRQAIGVGGEIIDICFDVEAELDFWPRIEALEARLYEIRAGNKVKVRDRTMLLSDAAAQAIDATNSAHQGVKSVGLLSGIPEFDALIGPMCAGDLIIIGGGVKQGKTALACQIMFGMAEAEPMWLYSGEMSTKQIAWRELARRTGITAKRQKQGTVGEPEMAQLLRARVEIEKLPVSICRDRLTIDQIRARCLQMRRQRGLGAVFIDHIGLIRWEGRMQFEDEFKQAQMATRLLKEMAGDLGVPIIAMTHLKKGALSEFSGRDACDRLRNVVTRRPRYTDLLGNLDKDADHVITPFHPRVILAGMEPTQGTSEYEVWQELMNDWSDKAELVLALSRENEFPKRREIKWNGPTTSYGPSIIGRQEALV